ncbi:asparagine synthase (glutamine-hydrolyzing) [Desulfogranum mediterraneum]|uniref:asparagine synthase (glutamine-hydrolyzing) n=1 Tax=Desulfogranum mediterraneum TaxID=160661 RepID=UPI00048F4E21|nr:asparagine synthase (glutamine-hydrolyzing) [Desulfogranum mediterraneum]
MCGIFGVVSVDPLQFDIERCTHTMSHRGPDDYGFHRDGYGGLGHRRLSIIDLSGSRQPIYNEDQTKCIVFNGEIYNFQELRQELLSRGHRFSTLGDTETILHAYEEWGGQCVDRLRGMFAFAIWDLREKKLFIARDRLGIKPLFYAQHQGRLYFASEMKAILADPSFPRTINELALNAYFSYSYIPAPLTIYSKINKLEPGHTLCWQNGELALEKYWDLQFYSESRKSISYYAENIVSLLQESVDLRMMSEVPLGAFLSGGIDSSTIVSLMSRGGAENINTFCIGFGGEVGGYLDERGYARQVADRYKTNHLDYEVVMDPEGLIEKIVRSFDEPFADDSALPSYFVCKVARSNVTVALSGLGGDEIFGGYERYLGFKLRGLYNRVPSFVRKHIIANMVARLPERSDGHYTINHMKRFVRSNELSADRCYLSYLSILSSGLRRDLFSDPGRFEQYHEPCDEIFLRHFNSDNVEGDCGSLDRALYCDFKTYLPEDILAVTDRLSMHHGLEVRVPFIDHKFLEFCATIPNDIRMKGLEKKYLLKKTVRPLLPRDVIDHRKQGFVGPMTQWLKHDLREYTLTTLTRANLEKHGLVNVETVHRVIDEHFSGKEIHDTLIWSLLVFQKWFDLYQN